MKGKNQIPEKCSSCGGELFLKNQYAYQCRHCGQEYYLSANKTHKISVHMSVGKMILLSALIVIAIVAAGILGYQYYTTKLVGSASRFSVVVRDFLMEVYDKPAAQITEEDLAKIKYLRIEKDGEYTFTYSFEDYFAYEDAEAYAKSLQTVAVKGSGDDFSPTNLQYFSGLTKVELYTGYWQNYKLPEENQIRCIYCVSGMSRYGNSTFFEDVNQDTLMEVVILNAGELDDYSFMEHLKCVHYFTLEGAKLKSTEPFTQLPNLEYLELDYVEIEKEKVRDYVEELLEIPTLTHFTIRGNTAWHISEEQWAELEESYGERITLTRE